MRSRLPLRRISTACAAALILTACDKTEPRGPGSIKVSASSMTLEPVELQYGISIDSGTPVMAAVGQPMNFAVHGLAHGKHTVATTTLPSQCFGTGSKDVTLRGDDTAKVAFTIACARTSGDVTVNVVTSGSNQDLNGYLVLVDQVVRGFVPSNGSTTIRYLPVGPHLLGLTDVASNCSAGATQSQTLTAGGVATATFGVTCTALSIIRVIASTSGAEPDPDGYAVLIDGVTSRAPANGTLTISAPIGAHTWTIGDATPNCALSGATSGSFTLAVSDTVTLNAQATCTAVGMGTVGVTAVDPAADTLSVSSLVLPAAHDIVGMTARYASGWVILVLRLASPAVAPGTGAARALFGVIDLDIDENAATGIIPLMNAFGGAAAQGSDYYVSFFAGDSASAELFKTTGLGLGSVGRVRATYDADSVIVKIPLNKIGGDDGNISVTMIVGTQDRPTDYAPNTGVITAHVPGSAIVGAGPVGSLRTAPPAPRAAFVRRPGSDWRPKP
jgi:hypothetical protein